MYLIFTSQKIQQRKFLVIFLLQKKMLIFKLWNKKVKNILAVITITENEGTIFFSFEV